MQKDELKKVAKDQQIVAISSAAHIGITDLLRALNMLVKDTRATIAAEETEDAATPRISLSATEHEKAWHVERKTNEDGQEYFEVTGTRIEKFARRTNFDGFQNVNRLRDIMKKMGIMHELTRQGAVGDSTIRIGKAEFTLLEQRED